MRLLFTGMLLWVGVCLGADGVPTLAPASCSDAAGAPACKAPAKDLKAARHAFSRGLKLQHSKNLDDAFSQFEEAYRLIPQNVEYLTAREMVRQQLVASHLERGNDNLQNGRQVEAQAIDAKLFQPEHRVVPDILANFTATVIRPATQLRSDVSAKIRPLAPIRPIESGTSAA